MATDDLREMKENFDIIDYANAIAWDVTDERLRQEVLKKSGKFPFTCADAHGLTNSEKLVVLTEEVGEVARAVLNLSTLATDRNKTVWNEALLRDELIQAAAVCFAWIEGLDRKIEMKSSE